MKFHYCLLAILWTATNSYAQTSNGIKPIGIGDTVPDIVFENIINYESTSARLSDFKGKLVILDFWNTHCTPCVALFPKLDSIQAHFRSKLQILAVTREDQHTVQKFYNAQKQKGNSIGVPSIVSDSLLKILFPHSIVPHEVLIDSNRIVKAIVGYNDITFNNLEKIINGAHPKVFTKQDNLTFSSDKYLLVNNNGGGEDQLLYHSIVSRYVTGVTSRSGRRINDSLSRIHALNANIRTLFKIAFDYNNLFATNRLILENVKDSSRYIMPDNVTALQKEAWNIRNLYGYELIMPRASSAAMHKMMQDDLNRFFKNYYNITASVSKRRMKCLAIVNVSGADNLKTKGGTPKFVRTGDMNFRINQTPARFANSLDMEFDLSTPIIDETGFTYNIDIVYPSTNNDFNKLKQVLRAFGLALKEVEREMDVLLIREN